MSETNHASDRWAVLIGINGYHESLGALSFCANDARLMHETLTSECCAFPGDNVVLLTDDRPKDRQPTFGNIHSWLGTWLSRPGPDDLVLVYFAGHGREANGQALLTPLDATLDSLPVTGIPIQYVRDLLDRCRAGQKVLLLDACHSGAGRDVAAMTSGFREALDAGKGLYTIASCDADQISYEWPEKQSGVFTHYVVEAIRHGAPAGTDGQVSLDHVYEWAREGILAWTAGKRLKQEPVRICRTKGEIHIATRPLSTEQQLEAARAQLRAQQETIARLRSEVDRLADQQAALPTFDHSSCALSTDEAGAVLNRWAARTLLVTRPIVDGQQKVVTRVVSDEFLRITFRYLCETRGSSFEACAGPPPPGEEPPATSKPFDKWEWGDRSWPDGWASDYESFRCIPAVSTGACHKCGGKGSGCTECAGSGKLTLYRRVQIRWKPVSVVRIWRCAELGIHVDQPIPEDVKGACLLDETRLGSEMPDLSALPPSMPSQITALGKHALEGADGKVRKVACKVEAIPMFRVSADVAGRPFEAELWGVNRCVVLTSTPPRSRRRVAILWTIVACVLVGAIAAILIPHLVRF
jgi:uncharacterized caspase-like protein